MRKALAHQPRIAIVGAGPAGLAAAFYLKERGYHDVLVLERMGREGGLCKSITDGYQVFDLGANYVTPAYEEVYRFARMVGAETYRAKPYRVGRRIRENGQKGMTYQSVMDYVRTNPDGTKIPRLKLLWGIARFAWHRRRVRRWVDAPTFADVEEKPELCVSFLDWLKRHRLEFMARLFEIPVPMMGYGFLDEIAAPYALKYMHPGTFNTMVSGSTPGLRRFRGTRRFVLGFQRMWEMFSWSLNVRTEVEIEHVKRLEIEDASDRNFRPIEIKMSYPDRLYYQHAPHAETHYFDRLILACPLNDEILTKIGSADDPGPGKHGFRLRVDLRPEEEDLFLGQVDTFNYCQVTCHAVERAPDRAGREEPFELEAPVVPIVPFEAGTIGRPWVAVQVWEQASRLLQFYTRAEKKPGQTDEDVREAVLKEVDEQLEHMNAAVAGEVAGDPRLKRWRTFHSWPYFGHVTPARFRSGFFTKLEKLQGRYQTYYAGGVTTFELVEAVVQSARHVVARLDEDIQRAWDEERWGPPPAPR